MSVRCRYYLRGNCKKGDQCTHRHDLSIYSNTLNVIVNFSGKRMYCYNFNHNNYNVVYMKLYTDVKNDIKNHFLENNQIFSLVDESSNLTINPFFLSDAFKWSKNENDRHRLWKVRKMAFWAAKFANPGKECFVTVNF